MISKALVAYYILALSKHDLKPFSKIEKCSSWFCRLLLFSKIAPGGPNNHMKLMFFSKIAPGGPNNPMKLMLFSKIAPRRAEYIMKLIFYFQKKSTKMSKFKLFTLLTPWNLHIFSKILPEGLDTPWNLHIFSKILPEGQPTPWNLYIYLKK